TAALNQRAEAAKAIAELEAARDAAIPDAIIARDEADERYREAMEGLKSAIAARDAARMALRGVSLRCDNARAAHLKLLKATADPSIAELRDELSDAYSTDPKSSHDQETRKRLQPIRQAALAELREKTPLL